MKDAKSQSKYVNIGTHPPGEDNFFAIHSVITTLDEDTFKIIKQKDISALKEYDKLKEQAKKGNREIRINLSPANETIIIKVLEQRLIDKYTVPVETEVFNELEAKDKETAQEYLELCNRQKELREKGIKYLQEADEITRRLKRVDALKYNYKNN